MGNLLWHVTPIRLELSIHTHPHVKQPTLFLHIQRHPQTVFLAFLDTNKTFLHYTSPSNIPMEVDKKKSHITKILSGSPIQASNISRISTHLSLKSITLPYRWTSGMLGCHQTEKETTYRNLKPSCLYPVQSLCMHVYASRQLEI